VFNKSTAIELSAHSVTLYRITSRVANFCVMITAEGKGGLLGGYEANVKILQRPNYMAGR
jgi:hypothetical protein